MKRWLILILMTIAGLAVMVLVDNYYRRQIRQENAQALAQTVEHFQNGLSPTIRLRLAAVENLKAFMLTAPILPDNQTFDRFAAGLLANYPDIRAVQYVDPDRIIRYIYPLAGNEAALDLDLTTRPAAPFVEKAIHERRTTVNNPTVTVQGSLSIVARAPLYRQDEFLGLVQGVFDIGDILETAGASLPPPYKFQLHDAAGTQFWGAGTIAGDTRTVKVTVGDNAWTLTLGWDTPPQPLDPLILLLIWGGGGLLLVSLLFIVNQTWLQTERLAGAVAEKTAELANKNSLLQAEIAERKQVERKALESKKRLSQALTAARAGAWEWDIATNQTRWSEENYLILGLDPEMGDTTHEIWLQCIHPEDRSAVEAEIVQAIETGNDLSIEFRIVRPDGAVRWINNVGRMIFDNEGEPTAMYGIQIDITERRLLEEQLWQTQRIEAIGQLAGGIAHDFNNILTIIGSSCELILGKLQPGDPLRRDLEPIWQAQERAASLTRQLLAFSRKQVLQPRVLNLNSVLANLDKMIHRLIGEDIDLNTLLDQELGSVKADPSQIEQVIMNLAINARDAMPYGGKLTLETANVYLDAAYARQHAEVDPGPYVMLAVTDTGGGMDEATKARIFEPFFTTKEPGKGTGLGLSTVHGIINQSGGHIWVYSEQGQGTTFKIYLPLIETAVEPDALHHVQPQIGRGTETILVVEDEAMVRNLVKNVLRASGYSILEAQQGTEAIEVAEQYTEPIHLLLTDVILPGGMSGPEIAQHLTSLDPDLKVLYMSGYTSDNVIVQQGVLDSDVAFLQKPFRSADLLYKVREVLDLI